MEAFESEAQLAQQVLEHPQLLDSFGYEGWAKWQRQEVEGLFGIPDLVLAFARWPGGDDVQVHLVAIELKLRNWQRALDQAYKYASFSHRAYVLMDACYVHRALAHIDEFKRSNIGLVSLSQDGNVQWHHDPEQRTPYSQALYERLRTRVIQDLAQ